MSTCKNKNFRSHKIHCKLSQRVCHVHLKTIKFYNVTTFNASFSIPSTHTPFTKTAWHNIILLNLQKITFSPHIHHFRENFAANLTRKFQISERECHENPADDDDDEALCMQIANSIFIWWRSLSNYYWWHAKYIELEPHGTSYVSAYQWIY